MPSKEPWMHAGKEHFLNLKYKCNESDTAPQTLLFRKKEKLKEVLEAASNSQQHTYLDARLADATTGPVHTELN